MAKSASIAIDDFDITCIQRYVVEYRATGTLQWQKTADQYAPPLIIDGLAPSTDYDYRITRYCCNGLVSDPATGTLTTPA